MARAKGTGDESLEGLTAEEKAKLKKYEALVAKRELAFVEEEKSLLKWRSQARPYKEREREFFTTIGAIVMLVSVILAFAGEFLAIAVVLSAAFLGYVLASVKPEELEHEITSRGIKTGGKLYHWDVLGRFWFVERLGKRVLMVETVMAFPRHLLLVIDKKDEEKMKKAMSDYLINEVPEPTALDKYSNWLKEKVPLEGA